MEQCEIDRINELAKKAKTDGLTQDEINEQKNLREKYLEGFRKNLRAQLENIYVIDENGNEQKLKRKNQ